LLAALLVAGCGDEETTLSVSEYAAQGMAVATVMEERIAALDAEWESQTPSVERVRSYWDRRLDAQFEALAGFEALEPPKSIAELHATGMPLFRKLIAAEEALAARVASFETVTGPDEWWGTAEAEAVASVNEETNALCLLFQAQYDATIERLSLSNASWVPSEMTEIVRIDVGCQ
jgi:hypothetical protein